MPRLLILLLVLTVAFVIGLSETTGTTQAQTPLGRDAIPGRYIVLLRDSALSAAAGSRAEDVRAQLQSRFNLQRELDFRGAVRGFVVKNVSETTAAQLRTDPRVLVVEPDRLARKTAQSLPTGIRRARIDQNVVANINGAGPDLNIDVAVLDTGVDSSHSDLRVKGGFASHCGPGEDCGEETNPCGANTTSYQDVDGHGTHVAGTIGAKDNTSGVVGVAPGAGIWAIKVLGDSGYGCYSDIIAGLDWIVLQPSIKVANMSLAGSSSVTLCTAIQNVVNAGISVVVAAGNDSTDAADTAPANCNSVISVSALADYNGASGGGAAATCGNYGEDDSLASFSNYGPVVDIAAPGVCILSTWPGGGLATLSGTSMATPHVAGAAALYQLQNPSWTPAQIRSTILNGAFAQNSACGFTGDPDSFGEPLLNLGQACSGGGGCTSPAKAVMQTPSPGSGLSAPSATFTWNAGCQVSSYWLYVGTTAVGSSNLHNQAATGTSKTVTNLPASGTIYVRLWSSFSGVWQSNDYTYVMNGGTGGGVDIQLTSGVPRSNQTVGVNQWLYYYISVPQNSSQLQVAITGSGDADLYTRLGSKPTVDTYDCRPYIGSSDETCTHANPSSGTWWFGVHGFGSATFTITATVDATASDQTPPTNATPASASHQVNVASTDTTVDITWPAVGQAGGASDAGSGVDGFSWSFSQTAGDTPDTTKDGEESVTAATSSALANGNWWFHMRTRDNAGNWSSATHLGPFVIQVGGGSCTLPTKAVMQTPSPGSTLSASSATFTWNAGCQVNSYYLYVGTTGAGSSNLHNQAVTGTSKTVSNLPASGTVYVRLWSQISGAWQSNDYTYTMSGGASDQTPPTNATPASASHQVNVASTDTTVDITWPAVGQAGGASDAGSGVDGFSWSFSQTAGDTPDTTKDGEESVTAATSSALANGNWWFHMRTRDNAGNWSSATHLGPFVIQVGGGSCTLPTKAVMQTPSPGSTLSASSATFTWNAGCQVNSYYLYVGTTGAGSNNLHNQTVAGTSRTVSNLPASGTVYVRLWSQISGAWQYNDYTYTMNVGAGGAAAVSTATPAARP